MENEEKMRREIRDEICRFMEQEMESDPTCPPYILAGLKVAQAVRALGEEADGLIHLASSLVDAEDVGRLRELEQYVKLVTTGIKQYLTVIRKDGAP